MKYIICLQIGMTVLNGFSQNVGIGTVTPVTKLDVVSGNNWNLVNGEGFIAPTGAVDDRLNFFSPVSGNILGLSGTGAVYFNGNAGNAGQVLKSGGAAGATVWTEPETMYTAVPNPSPYVMMLDNIPGYVYSNVSHTINLNVPSTVLISASFNADVTSCAFCGAGVNQITMIIDGTELSNKPFFLTAPSGGLTNVTISNYPISMAAGSHTIQFKANHITPSTNTGVQAIYSTIIVKPN